MVRTIMKLILFFIYMPFNIKINFLNYASKIYFVLPLNIHILDWFATEIKTFYTNFCNADIALLQPMVN